MPGNDDSPKRSQKAPLIGVRYLVLIWLCLAAALAYDQRFLLPVSVSIVERDLAISDYGMSWAMASFFITYAIFQIPGGWLADRWGSRTALAVSVAFCSLATTATAFATGLTGLIIVRLAAGIGQAGIFPAATGCIARWFPSGKRAVASGYLTGFMQVGGAGAAALGGWALQHGLGWPWLFVIFSLPGVAWAAGFYVWFRNRPEEHASVTADELATIRGPDHVDQNQDELTSEPTPWLALLRSRAMWLIAGQQFFRAAGYALFASWFPKYLEKIYGSSVEEAGVLTSIAVIAVGVGSPLGGIVSDRMLQRSGSRHGSRKMLSAVTMFLCAAFFLGSAYVSTSLQAIALIAPAAFFGAIAGPAAYAITIDMGDRHVGTVFSIMNMGGNIGASIFPIVVGWLVKWTGRWDWIPMLVAGIYVAGAACWILLNPRGTVFDSQAES